MINIVIHAWHIHVLHLYVQYWLVYFGCCFWSMQTECTYSYLPINFLCFLSLKERHAPRPFSSCSSSSISTIGLYTLWKDIAALSYNNCQIGILRHVENKSGPVIDIVRALVQNPCEKINVIMMLIFYPRLPPLLTSDSVSAYIQHWNSDSAPFSLHIRY